MSTVTPAPRPLRLDCLGLNQRMQQRFEMVFTGAGRGVAVFVNTTVAEAVMVDLDNPAARRDWPRYREAFPKRPAILLSMSPLDCAAPDTRLGKPIEIGALLKAAVRIRNHLDRESDASATAGTDDRDAEPKLSAKTEARTIVLDDPAEDPALFQKTLVLAESPLARAAPNKSRAGLADAPPLQTLDVSGCLLENAMRWRETLRERTTPGLLRWQTLWFLYEPESTRIACSLSRAELAEICNLPCGGAVMEEGEAPLELADRVMSQPDPIGSGWPDPDALIWDLALWTYGDQVPLDTPVEERLYLAHWPNLTRLTLTPNALRIAALWVEQPLSLYSIAEALRVPLRDVTRFYSACHSIGIAGPARRSADQLFRTAPVPVAAERPLFGRMVSRLRGLIKTRPTDDGQPLEKRR